MKPRKSYIKFGSCANMEPIYCGPFEVFDRIGPVAYRIALSANMRAHNVFYVSLLNKYVHDLNHIIDWNVIQVEPKGEFQVEPMSILDKKVTLLRNRAIGQVKVQWKHLGPDKYIWELEDVIKEAYAFLFKF